ncbi:MAG: MgtC/SapB family protein [Patescibacteria group bacterium]
MPTPSDFLDPNIIIFAKLSLAMLLGAIVGTERAILARQAAGTRTFGLVALGSCLLIVISNYVNGAYLGVMDFDPMRLAAGIVTGVGFLGAGVIIFRGNTVHGVTTAAGLWMVSAVGMAVGFGMYTVAIFAILLTLLMFTGMWYVENRFRNWFGDHGHDTDHRPL